MMDQEEQRRAFVSELWHRYDELQQWAIEHWPDQQRPLTSADFTQARLEILELGAARPAPQRQQLEPAAGGVQYVDVTPAPWP
ncbi:hypothetical protein AAKU55_005396 [Oxalobacteraceae bacterium GrIS 1.11]